MTKHDIVNESIVNESILVPLWTSRTWIILCPSHLYHTYHSCKAGRVIKWLEIFSSEMKNQSRLSDKSELECYSQVFMGEALFTIHLMHRAARGFTKFNLKLDCIIPHYFP